MFTSRHGRVPATRLPTFNVKSKNIGEFVMKRELLSLLVLFCGTFGFAQTNIKKINVGQESVLEKMLGKEKYEIDSLVLSGTLLYSQLGTLRDCCMNGRLSGINMENCNIITFSVPSFTIPDRAFDGCENLRYITLPKYLREIGAQAFYLTGLRGVIVPKLVKKIGRLAFAFCDNLKKVTIKAHNANCVGIEPVAFEGTDIRELEVQQGFSDGVAQEKLLWTDKFNKISEVQDLFVTRKLNSVSGISDELKLLGDERYKIDSLVVEGALLASDFPIIKDMAENGRLTGLNLESCNVENNSIPEYAFDREPESFFDHHANTASLRYLTFPKNLKLIGTYAFYGGYFIDLRIPKGCEIEKNAFCASIIEGDIILPEGMKVLETTTFSLVKFYGENIYIPSSMEKMKLQAFNFMRGYPEITLKRNVYMDRLTPPDANILEGGPFMDNGENIPENYILYVPVGTKEIYQNDVYFKHFQTIIETDKLKGGTSGIKGAVQDVQSDGLVEVYTIDGRLVHKGKDMPQLGKGMYVVRENGKARKVAVNK